MLKGAAGQAGHGAPAGQGVGGPKHALLAEQIRIRHIRNALACAADGVFRARCEVALAASAARALHLERSGHDAAGQAGHCDAPQLDECLLSAMELARANGDAGAAEAVAQECLALVEVHCRTLLDLQPSGTFDPAFEDTGFSKGAGGT